MGLDVKRMERQLRIWRAKIDDLTARALEAGPNASHAVHEQIDDLKARCALMQVRLDLAQASGGTRRSRPDGP